MPKPFITHMSEEDNVFKIPNRKKYIPKIGIIKYLIFQLIYLQGQITI